MKKKKTSQTINRWLFLGLWILAHIVAWGGTFWLVDNLNPSGDLEMVLAFTIVLGLVPGALLSFPQKYLLKRGLELDINWWRRGSLIAWVMGGFLLWSLVQYISSEPSIPIFILAWFAPLILAQYALMRQHIQRASLVALGSIASVIVFAQSIEIYSSIDIERFAFAGGLQGAVTGLTLLWLYGMIQQEKAKHEFAQDNAVREHLGDKTENEHYQLEDGTHSVSNASL